MTRSKWARTIAMTGAAVAFLVWQSIQATRVGYDVERSRRRLGQLKAQLAARQMDWEKRVTPAQLSHQARTRLGMHPADPRSIRVLEAALTPGSSS